MSEPVGSLGSLVATRPGRKCARSEYPSGHLHCRRRVHRPFGRSTPREGGADVVVLDAGGAGFGASERNGGRVLPGLKWDPDEMVRMLGTERGERLTAFAGAAPDLVYRLVEKHGIDCGLHLLPAQPSRCG